MAVPILRLNVDDNPRIIVKQDQQPVTTFYTFVESGCTQITTSTTGNHVTVTIYSNPTGQTATLIGSGDTTVTNINDNTWVIYSPTGSPTGGTSDWSTLPNRPEWLTGTTLNDFENAHSHSQYLTGITCNMVTGYTDGLYVHNDTFNTYTDTTAPNTLLKLDQTIPQSVTGGSPQFYGIQFDLAGGQTRQIGKLMWSDDNGCLEYGLNDDVTLQVGEEVLVRVKNTGANILNGDIVYINGANDNIPTVAKADCRYHYSEPLFMATEDINTNNNGWVTQTGVVNNLNTDAYSEGTTMWLYTGGTITNVQPSLSNWARRRIGVVTRKSATIGAIYFDSVTASRLNYLTDVYSATTTTGAFPKYNAGNGTFIWDNVNNYITKSDFNGHTGDTTIHYEMSAITITENQISDLKDYALESDLTDLTQTVSNHTGDTTIHFKMSDIIGFTTTSDFNTYTGTTAPNTYFPISGYSFVESGGTQISVVGNEVTIYSPTGGTGSAAWSDITDKPAWIDSVTASAAEINVLDGIPAGLTSTELGYVDGVTSAIQTQLDAKADKLALVKTVTGTTYTIQSTDSGYILECTATGATTITLPTGLTTNFQITIVNYGGATSGVKTIAAGTGATIKSANSALKLSTQYGAATAYYRGSNTWVVFGDLTT